MVANSRHHGGRIGKPIPRRAKVQLPWVSRTLELGITTYSQLSAGHHSSLPNVLRPNRSHLPFPPPYLPNSPLCSQHAKRTHIHELGHPRRKFYEGIYQSHVKVNVHRNNANGDKTDEVHPRVAKVSTQNQLEARLPLNDRGAMSL